MAFIDLTNVDILEEVSEDAKVLVEENGAIKRTAMPKMKESDKNQSIYDVVIRRNTKTNECTLLSGSYEIIREKMNKGLCPSVFYYYYEAHDSGDGNSFYIGTVELVEFLTNPNKISFTVGSNIWIILEEENNNIYYYEYQD